MFCERTAFVFPSTAVQEGDTICVKSPPLLSRYTSPQPSPAVMLNVYMSCTDLRVVSWALQERSLAASMCGMVEFFQTFACCCMFCVLMCVLCAGRCRRVTR
jgi:hypothetical protein